MPDNKKKRFEIDADILVKKKIVVYAETPEEAITKALRKNVSGRNKYEHGGYIYMMKMCASSKRTLDTAVFSAVPSKQVNLRKYDFGLYKEGELLLKNQGNFDDEIIALEQYVKAIASKE